MTSEESVTCVAVKEDRVEDPWTIETGVRFIYLLGYREITLKRVAEMSKAKVTTEDAVKGNKPSNGFIEITVILPRGIIRTIQCHFNSSTEEELREDSPVLPSLVEHAGSILSMCRKGRNGRKPIERLHDKKPPQQYVRNLALKEKQQCKMLHWRCRRCVQNS